jgi:hypothetical protein
MTLRPNWLHWCFLCINPVANAKLPLCKWCVSRSSFTSRSTHSHDSRTHSATQPPASRSALSLSSRTPPCHVLWSHLLSSNKYVSISFNESNLPKLFWFLIFGGLCYCCLFFWTKSPLVSCPPESICNTISLSSLLCQWLLITIVTLEFACLSHRWGIS